MLFRHIAQPQPDVSVGGDSIETCNVVLCVSCWIENPVENHFRRRIKLGC